MCAEVLAGGRAVSSWTWKADRVSGPAPPGDAEYFGNRLRTFSPYGRVDISIDARPWRINLVPMPSSSR